MLFSYYGIDNYSPFYSKSITSFTLNMPDHFKINNGKTRNILRQFISLYLDDEIANRPTKSILTPGIQENLSEIDINLIKHELKNIHIDIKDIIDEKYLHGILAKARLRHIEEYEILDLMAFFSVNIFLNTYFKKL